MRDMQIKAVDHLVITTGDLEACLAFYCGVLGMEHAEAKGRHALRFGAQINIHTRAGEFQPAALNPTRGSQDFCLIVEGDIEAVKEELEARGCPIVEGIVERAGALGPIRSVYLRDPDGNLVELAQYDGGAGTA